MVPAEVSNGDDCMVDLDDDAKQRLMALKSQIDNMLKIRSDDWTRIIQFEQLEFNELLCKKFTWFVT